MAKFIKIMLFIVVINSVIGQNLYNQGSLSFSYGTVIPNQSWAVSGSILPTSDTAAGSGAFISTNGDTSLFIALAYQLSPSDSSTVMADVFVLSISDTGTINDRTYLINPFAGLPVLYGWIPQVDAGFVDAIINGGGDLDSLLTMSVRLSTMGNITVSSISDGEISIGFTGAVFDTGSLQAYLIGNGSGTFQNTMPVPDYVAGSVSFDFDGTHLDATGNFDPVNSSAGATGITTMSGDTSNYSLVAYRQVTTGEYNIFGLRVRTIEPLESGTVSIAPPGTTFPESQCFYLPQATLTDLLLIITNPDFGTLDSLISENLYVGLSGTVDFTRTSAAWDGTFSAQMIPLGSPQAVLPLENGSFHLSSEPFVGVTTEPIVEPSQFTLNACYPNPFNPTTTISFTLDSPGKITLSIYDLNGHLVTTLLNETLPAGLYSRPWSPTRQSSGLYFVRLSNGNRLVTQKVLYLK